MKAIIYITKSLAGRAEDADGRNYPIITPGGSSVPGWTYRASQKECRLLQRVQNLPAASWCGPLSPVGAWDDVVSVPPADHQELWTSNCRPGTSRSVSPRACSWRARLRTPRSRRGLRPVPPLRDASPALDLGFPAAAARPALGRCFRDTTPARGRSGRTEKPRGRLGCREGEEARATEPGHVPYWIILLWNTTFQISLKRYITSRISCKFFARKFLFRWSKF